MSIECHICKLKKFGSNDENMLFCIYWDIYSISESPEGIRHSKDMGSTKLFGGDATLIQELIRGLEWFERA